MATETWPLSRERLIELRQAGQTSPSIAAMCEGEITGRMVRARMDTLGIHLRELDFSALDARLRDLHRRGLARTEMATELNVPIQTIHTRCHTLGLPDCPRKPPEVRHSNLPNVWPPPVEDMRHLLEVEKWRISDIARHYKRRGSTVSSFIARAKLVPARVRKSADNCAHTFGSRRCNRCGGTFQRATAFMFFCDPCKRSDEWRIGF